MKRLADWIMHMMLRPHVEPPPELLAQRTYHSEVMGRKDQVMKDANERMSALYAERARGRRGAPR